MVGAAKKEKELFQYTDKIYQYLENIIRKDSIKELELFMKNYSISLTSQLIHQEGRFAETLTHIINAISHYEGITYPQHIVKYMIENQPQDSAKADIKVDRLVDREQMNFLGKRLYQLMNIR